MGCLGEAEDEGHLRQILEMPGLVDGLTSQDCAVIEEISSSGEEEKLCWDPASVK